MAIKPCTVFVLAVLHDVLDEHLCCYLPFILTEAPKRPRATVVVLLNRIIILCRGK